MKIVQCTGCGKYIYKGGSCFHCGNTTGFEDLEVSVPQIHENAAAEYSQAEIFIESKKFDEARSLLYTVTEWMPDFAEAFWLRLLTKKKCTSAAELIAKGFDCEEDADFCNALKFSTGVEHGIYLDVREMVAALRKALQIEISNHEYRCKMQTDILQIKKNMQGEMDLRKRKLFSLWSDLKETEHAMYALEMDCKLRSKEHTEVLEMAASAASSLKKEVYQLEECTAKDFHKYQVEIGSILQCSEQAKAALEEMKKQHPWVHDFNDLEKKRDEQVSLIGEELASLRSYESTIQKTLDSIDRIAERHRKAVHAIEDYDFLDAANLLGKDCYNRILQTIGLGVGVQIPVSPQDWQPGEIAVSPIVGDVDDGADLAEDFVAWGLPNDNY